MYLTLSSQVYFHIIMLFWLPSSFNKGFIFGSTIFIHLFPADSWTSQVVLFNYIDTKAKCRHLKSWPVKGLCGRFLSVWGPLLSNVFVWGGLSILQVMNLVRNRVLNSCWIWCLQDTTPLPPPSEPHTVYIYVLYFEVWHRERAMGGGRVEPEKS